MQPTRPARARRRARLLAMGGAALAAALTIVGGGGPASAQEPLPYTDPPWADTCTVHEFGEGESPEPGSLGDDPLCVRYAKEDITVDDGGALAFIGAEPNRILAAVPACRYWQQDRWSVQVSDSSAALVSWEGSYWFDRGAGQGAARFLDFQVGGVPASAEQVAALIEPLSAEWADALRAYGPGTGGRIELGGGDPSCAPSDPPSDPGDGDPALPGDGDVDPTALDAAPSPAGRALPSTGGTAPTGLAGLAVAAALAATWLLRALRLHRAPTATP